MSVLHLYGVYIARFPYLGSSEDKLRPIVVVSQPYGSHEVIAIVPISAQPKKESVDFSLQNWEDSGLIKPSVARVHRLLTMLESDLKSHLGTLTPSDINTLQKQLKIFLSL